jgi:hypothetical protein
MKLVGSLPVLAILTALCLSPSVASAQTPALASPVHLDLDRPAASFSSSSANEFMLAAPAASSAAAPAAAAQHASHAPFSGLGADVKVGLAGIGFDVATPLVPARLNLRGGASFFSYNLSETTSDNLVVNGTLKLQNSGIMLDWFPFGGRFRLSGGATVYNNKGVTATLNEPSGSSFTLGNDKYYASGPVTGSGIFTLGGKTGGRVSFGTGNLLPKKGRFTFQSELGVEFVSAPTVALAFSGNVCTSAQGANCATPTNISSNPMFQADITSEQAKLQNDVNFVRYYPILSFGVGFKIH